MAKKHIDDAMWAHTNLTVFHAIVAMLEGGTIRGSAADATAQRVIAICKKETYRQLKLMDSALAKAEQNRGT